MRTVATYIRRGTSGDALSSDCAKESQPHFELLSERQTVRSNDGAVRQDLDSGIRGFAQAASVRGVDVLGRCKRVDVGAAHEKKLHGAMFRQARDLGQLAQVFEPAIGDRVGELSNTAASERRVL